MHNIFQAEGIDNTTRRSSSKRIKGVFVRGSPLPAAQYPGYHTLYPGHQNLSERKNFLSESTLVHTP